MKKQPPVALVCAGPVNRGSLGSLPGIVEKLRWIKTGHVSSTTRAVNTLGCGTAVREYAGISGAEIVLVKAPEPVVADLVAEMADAALDWTGRTVVLVDTDLDSMALAPLEQLGAFPASLTRLNALPDTVLLEGHAEAVRAVRRLLRSRSPQVIEIHRGCKHEYLAGVRLGTSSFLPTIAGAIDHFLRAGMQKAAAEKTAAFLFEDSIRAYFRAGKRLLRNRSLAVAARSQSS
jgi:hypothetical protein